MSKIAVLGLGAMGSRMAANLLKAGHELTVWNRTASAAEPLVKGGARQAETPRQAAEGAEFVMAMLRDDDASRQVWLDPESGALVGMAERAVAIESSTLTPDWVRELGEQVASRGLALLEAPVSGSRPQAEAAKLIHLVGGDADTLARAKPLLDAMGAGVHHVGPLGHGALVKLATNSLLGIQVTALAEIIGLLGRTGVDVEKALAAIAGTPVWAPVANYLTSTMVEDNFAPQFPVELIDKDFRYTLQVAGEDAAVPMIATAHRTFQRAADQGLGEENMTAVVKLYR
jgi:3-hydroxyisobutyrate dehydrogenase